MLLLALLAAAPLAAQDAVFNWDYPRAIADGPGRFPRLFPTSWGAAVLWQESEATSAAAGAASGAAAGGRAWISRACWDGSAWRVERRLVGPFEFRGAEPVLFSAAAGADSTILLAVASEAGTIELFLSPGGRDPFSPAGSLGGAAEAVETVDPLFGPVFGPRVYASSTGGWLLFASRAKKAVAQAAETAPAAPAAGPAATPAPAVPPAAVAATVVDTVFADVSIALARSADGRTWSAFGTFVPDSENLVRTFLPVSGTVADAAGRLVDIVVFQSLVTENDVARFQLFSKASADGGATWGVARRLTAFVEPGARERAEATNYDNQRPFLARVAGRLYLSWERTPAGGLAQAYLAEIGPDGAAREGTVERVSADDRVACTAPEIVAMDGTPALVWSDTRSGTNRMFLSRKQGAIRARWAAVDVTGPGADATFGAMTVLADGSRLALWQRTRAGASAVWLREPDRSAAAPLIAAQDWSPGTRTRRELATARVTLADDFSGWEGFSWSWGRDPAAEPPRAVRNAPAESRLVSVADADGTWWFAVAGRDGVGNWSPTTRLRFDRDRTPPPPPLLLLPETDDRGFLPSNTFDLAWELAPWEDPALTDDVAGYTWLLRRVGDIERPGQFPVVLRGGEPAALPGLTAWESRLVSAAGPPLPPQVLLGAGPKASYVNIENGYWLFSAAAIDGVGNVGDAATMLLRADKFRPYTAVTSAEATRDDFGRTSLRVFGRGYLAEGRVTRVILDRDGREPWDWEAGAAPGAAAGFTIPSDRELGGISFEGLEAGDYRVGLFHEKRGWFWTRPTITIDVSGTVKFGLPTAPYVPSWRVPAPSRAFLDFGDAFLAAATLFGALGLLISSLRLAGALRESAAIRSQVLALISGGPMPGTVEKAAVAKRVRRRVSALAIKFTLTITSLVIFVVILVSVPLGIFMTRTRGTDLATGLEGRAKVLLESIATGARDNLPTFRTLQLGQLVRQTSALGEEALYATVTGRARQGSTDINVVWATNDPAILVNPADSGKIDTATYAAGSSRIKDPISELIASRIVADLDAKAQAEVGADLAALFEMNDTARRLQAKADAGTITAQERTDLASVNEQTPSLEQRISDGLLRLSDAAIGSQPAFDTTVAASKGETYLFFKPVLLRPGTPGDSYYRGMVRLEVSAEKIRRDVRAATINLVLITLAIAAIALGIGVIGSVILASIIARPIRKIIDAIEHIRTTEDKSELETYAVEARTKGRDELDDLADAANALKDGLVDAAKASKALEEGSDIQQLLIPLDEDRGSRKKLTVSRRDTPGFEMFGYYKGAKKVSGDYWDFKPCDESGRFWYFIKCDVSGKDVAAAFIMVQVATMVINHFKKWDRTSKLPGYGLDSLTYDINGFLNDRGYRGKFAAFTLGVYSVEDGGLHACHAGDNVLRFYNAAQGRTLSETLHSTPAAGPLENWMVEGKQPYLTVRRGLARGDILLLYTDGMEDAYHQFRDAGGKVVSCTEIAAEGDEHLSHNPGEESEHIGPERLDEFVAAYDARRPFRLRRSHETERDIPMSFDFTKATGELEERILSYLAVGRVFSIWDANASDEHRILVDRRIDGFLKKYFDQYSLVFRKEKKLMVKTGRILPDGKEETAEDPNYLAFTGIRDDIQYDDLTILGIRRK